MCTHNYEQRSRSHIQQVLCDVTGFYLHWFKKIRELRHFKVGVMIITSELYEYEWIHKFVYTYELKQGETRSKFVISFFIKPAR